MKQAGENNTKRSHHIIDVRSLEQYNKGHARNAHSFPLQLLPLECCGLPPRDCELTIVVSNSSEEVPARAYFERLGFPSFTVMRIEQANHLTRELPSGFCWTPNPFLAENVDLLERQTRGSGIALDVGSGTGRDTVFLAARGWAVIGLEKRLKLVQQARLLAIKHGAEHSCSHVHCDIAQGFSFRAHTFDMVMVCRFIDRNMFPAVFAVLKPGGVFLYSHFLEGCDKTSVGHPSKPSGYFFSGELEQLFVSAGCSLLLREESNLPDGRPMIHILALKRSAV